MKNLVNELGEIIRWPKKPSDKEIVIQFLSTKFEIDRRYSEKEVNEVLGEHHLFDDIPLLRGELVSSNILARQNDGSQY